MSDLPFDPWALNAADLIKRIGTVTDKDVLHALYERELTHPKYAPGRQTVMDAIQERLGEIVQAEASEAPTEAASEPEPVSDEQAAFEAAVVPADPVFQPEPSFWVHEFPKPVQIGDVVTVVDAGGSPHDAVVLEAVSAFRVKVKNESETVLTVVEGHGPMTYRRK